MIPGTFGALYAFLGLIAPGLVFEFVRERRRPHIEETAFREASRVALSSLVFTVLSILSLLAVGAFKPHWLPDVKSWLRPKSTYAADNYLIVGRTLLLELVLACSLSAAAAYLLGRGSRGSDISQHSIWYELFRRELPEGMTTRVHVGMTDGCEFWGYIKYYTTETGLAERELAIQGADLAIRMRGSPDIKALEPDWQYVVLRGADIAWMKITYQPTA